MIRVLVNGFGCLILVTLLSFKSLTPVEDVRIQLKDTAANDAADVVVTEIASKNEEAEFSVKAQPLVTPEMLTAKLHPLVVSFVQDFNKKNEKRFEKIKEKNTRQLSLIDGILLRSDLPQDLKYLAIIESGLEKGAISHKGAVGPWQFMAPTARLMGLTVNKSRDERNDLSKSTHAAVKYLKLLYKQFNDWDLVLAAYNCGAGRVEYAIKKSSSRDFWKLQHHLPAESRGHVKKFIATRHYFDTKLALENLQVAAISTEKLTGFDAEGVTSVVISGKYRAAALAKNIGMEQSIFDAFNPGFDAEVASNGYQLRLPKEKMDLFVEKKHQILAESVEILLNESASIISNPREEFPKEAIVMNKPKAITGDNRSKRKK